MKFIIALNSLFKTMSAGLCLYVCVRYLRKGVWPLLFSVSTLALYSNRILITSRFPFIDAQLIGVSLL